MSGLYIHIPYCRKRCNYCDFYKETSLQNKATLLDAIGKELALRKTYLSDNKLSTIYFGGGTPSVLSYDEINLIFETIYKYYKISEQVEVSFEANPDDLTPAYLQMLGKTPINRLSIGIQSFDDKVLQLMNRRHSSSQAVNAVREAKEVGFENISLDIIYGVPNTNVAYLQENLAKLVSLEPLHISAYHLSIEEGTPFARMKKEKYISEIEDKESEEQYHLLVSYLQDKGYEQYEISNFCQGEAISQHNTSYWMQQEYLGVGPSAHSYDKVSRQWNIANTNLYVSALQEDKPYFEKEILSVVDAFNDYLMVRLRTKWGVDVAYLKRTFGEKMKNYFLGFVSEHHDFFETQGDFVRIKPNAFLQADYLIRKIFVT